MPCGFLNIDKPSGPTSRRVLDVVARLVRPVRAGHAGTLDPLATGVLVVAVGRATRLISRVQSGTKQYRTRFLLGQTSQTDDISGDVQVSNPAPDVSRDRLEKALSKWVGRFEQVPPQFSAVKVDGRRAYALARGGDEVHLEPRTIEVQRIEVLDWKSPELELEITCGSGTYIRALARDLGVALGCGALMAELVRTRVGSFEITGAVSPDVLTAENLRDHLQPPLVAVAELSRQVCNDEEVVAIGHGRRVPCRVSRQDSEVQVALVDAAENLLAVAEVRPDTGELAPRHVFVGQ